jgi:hypothetical protein
VGVTESHLDGRVPREFLDGSDRDATEGKPRTKGVAHVVESEILNLFERLSVARDHELLAEALRHGRGRISHAESKGTLALQESSGTILRDRNEIATARSLRREREMIGCVNLGIGAVGA